VATGDFNHDGRIDLATANWGNSTVTILLGNGDGSFNATTNYPVGSYPRMVAVADFNGDGRLDLATDNQGNSTVSVLTGNGDGSFASAGQFDVQGAPDGITVADFDSDGQPDIAAMDSNGTTVSVLLNQTFPRLQFSMLDNALVLSWPTNAAAWALESNTNGLLPNAWFLVTNTPVVIGKFNFVTNILANGSCFYRLER
jgi:hypothetical protein